MITHEEARALVNWKKGSKLFDYISQQEKITELLKLYQTLYENNNEHDYDLAPELVEEMEKRIEQLEKELREMK